jgi:hypothetical protein
MVKPISILILGLILGSMGNLMAQADQLGSWNILHVKYKMHPKWTLFAEAQVRSLAFYHQFHYHEYKGGFTYTLDPKLLLTLGAGDYDTYKEGGNFRFPKNNAEFRLWPQVTLLQKIGPFKIEQRYRMEMRFRSDSYRNRFRYRVGIVWEKKKMTWQFNNELFFTDNEPYFERNRVAIAFYYKISPEISVQLGYLHQFDYKINDETGRDFLQTGLYFELKK